MANVEKSGPNVKFLAFGAAGLILVVIIIVLVFQKVGVESKEESQTPTAEQSETPPAEEVPAEPTEPTEPTEPEEPAEPEEPTESTEPEEPTEPSEPAEPSEPEEPAEPAEPAEPTDSSGPGTVHFEGEKVPEPKAEGDFKAGGFILEKYTILEGSQYQYVLDIRLTNDSGSTNITYFVTKSAYDGLNVGDILTVHYVSTGNGTMAVESISK